MNAIPAELLERYFASSSISAANKAWFHINSKAFEDWALAEENREQSGMVLEDFERMDELGRNGPAIVVRAFHKYGIEAGPRSTPQEMAMVLFLDHHHAFDFARSKYALLGGTGTLSLFALDGGTVSTGSDQLQAFTRHIREWFGGQAKGEHCDLYQYTEHGETIFLIQRGTYMAVKPVWQEPQRKIITREERPAVEDILTFDARASELRIKTALDKDRDAYLKMFC